MKRLCIFFFVIFFLTGCAARSIESSYSNQLENLKPGMPIETFKAIFPRAYFRGFSGDTKVYVLERRKFSPFMTGANPWSGMVDQKLYFYFKNEKLVQWGKPQDWADNSIKVIKEVDRIHEK